MKAVDVIARIDRIAVDCSIKNWDSHGAAPVTAEAIDTARILAQSLYAVPTTNGGISLFFAAEGITVVLDAAGAVSEFYADLVETADYVAAVRKRAAIAAERDVRNADG